MWRSPVAGSPEMTPEMARLAELQARLQSMHHQHEESLRRRGPPVWATAAKLGAALFAPQTLGNLAIGDLIDGFPLDDLQAGGMQWPADEGSQARRISAPVHALVSVVGKKLNGSPIRFPTIQTMQTFRWTRGEFPKGSWNGHATKEPMRQELFEWLGSQCKPGEQAGPASTSAGVRALMVGWHAHLLAEPVTKATEMEEHKKELLDEMTTLATGAADDLCAAVDSAFAAEGKLSAALTACGLGARTFHSSRPARRPR